MNRTPYSMAFACLQCRKSFKRQSGGLHHGSDFPNELPCPDCGGSAHNFGRHFKAPKKTDRLQWQKVRFLFQHGFRFQKIRIRDSTESVPYPDTLQEARVFVERYRDHAIDRDE